jgi:hypothetical protein
VFGGRPGSDKGPNNDKGIIDMAKGQATAAGSARKPPGDFTGRQQEEKRAKAAKEIQDREAELAMMQQAEQQEKDNTVIDLSDPQDPKVLDAESFEEQHPAPLLTDVEVDDEPITVQGASRTVVLVADLHTAFGVDDNGNINELDFEGGRRYVVSAALADHLQEKGWVWSS